MSGAGLPFDVIHVGEEALSVAAFLAMPLHLRVQHIAAGSLAFTLKGRPVERRSALSALRDQWAKQK